MLPWSLSPLPLLFLLPLALARPALLLPAFRDYPVGPAVMPRLRAERRESPGRLRVVALHAAFATAMRMVHRIHGYPAHRGAAAMPAGPARFTVGHVLVIEIAHLAHRGHAVQSKPPHLARRQFHQREQPLFAEQLRRSASGTN